MSQPTSSSFLHRDWQGRFDALLLDYQNQTGTKLDDHLLAKKLEKCDSVQSITTIIQKQAQDSRRYGDGLMKSLEVLVEALYPFSISTFFGEGICLAKAIFAGIAVLLAAVKDFYKSYSPLFCLFKDFENFLGRIGIYTETPPTPALKDVLVEILVELFPILTLATKRVKQGRIKTFSGIRGEEDFEAVILRLDRLTLNDVRAAAAQTVTV